MTTTIRIGSKDLRRRLRNRKDVWWAHPHYPDCSADDRVLVAGSHCVRQQPGSMTTTSEENDDGR